jgi:hypothetical protein
VAGAASAAVGPVDVMRIERITGTMTALLGSPAFRVRPMARG